MVHDMSSRSTHDRKRERGNWSASSDHTGNALNLNRLEAGAVRRIHRNTNGIRTSDSFGEAHLPPARFRWSIAGACNAQPAYIRV